jgi:glycosyltransferase involved in cell wall biosynthesis
MLHILFLPSWYPNHKNDLDGNFIQNHARAAAIHHNVSVLFVTSIPDLNENFKIEKKKSSNLTELYVYYKDSSFIIIKLYRILKSYYLGLKNIASFDLIHSHVFEKIGIFSILIAFLLNKKIILSEHNSNLYKLDTQRNQIKTWYAFWYKKYDAILPVSNSLKTCFMELGIPQNKLNVIYNVVDTSFFKYEVNRLENKKFEFLHISNFARIKNIEGILIAFKKLLEDDPSCNLTILGDGNLQDVINQANSLKIPQENIHFVGKIMPDFLAVYYQNADTFILNSHKETFGVVLAESLCCGCPVITTKNGGYSDEMTTEEGFVIPPNDSEALLKAMKKMIATKNQWHRDEIAQNAVSKFGETAISGQLDTIYQKIFNS